MMKMFKEIETNKIYIVEDVFSTGLTEFSKLKSLFNISNNNFIKDNDKLNCFFASILEKDTRPNIYVFPFQCFKICELIFHLKKNYKERTNDNIFPFSFYIRKSKNNEILFIPLDKKIRQLLFGIYEKIYKKVPIIKGFLYCFKCNFKSIEIYKTDIPSEKFLLILQKTDKNLNNTLNHNCMICRKNKSLKECNKCKWALYCSDECYNNEKYQNHISDELFDKKMEYYNELKL